MRKVVGLVVLFQGHLLVQNGTGTLSVPSKKTATSEDNQDCLSALIRKLHARARFRIGELFHIFAEEVPEAPPKDFIPELLFAVRVAPKSPKRFALHAVRANDLHWLSRQEFQNRVASRKVANTTKQLGKKLEEEGYW